MKKRLRRLLITLLIIIVLITIPNVYAFYFSNHKSSIISKFQVNNTLGNSYVRAIFLTYWIDTTSCSVENDYSTCDISGKSSWNLKESVINENWYLLEDGNYYYKTSIDGNRFDSESIKTSDMALIDPSLNIQDLTDEQLTGLEVIPQYEVIYEFIDGVGVSDAWGVTYSNGTPTLINTN